MPDVRYQTLHAESTLPIRAPAFYVHLTQPCCLWSAWLLPPDVLRPSVFAFLSQRCLASSSSTYRVPDRIAGSFAETDHAPLLRRLPCFWPQTVEQQYVFRAHQWRQI